MLALPDLQRAFLGAVLGGHTGVMAGLVRGDGIPPERRLRIYANNARSNFLTTLRATYPVIERLGGPEWFAQAAARYQSRHPSRCGDLQYVGRDFPAFLRGELDDTAYGYFSDVARLEWAYQEV
ncbi:MAG: DNA-binding domain-containing protein, partial [Gammaproteobacteria bacterium]|nr:DNA-binding domain-containing protein [Gammaproteobacteria bacterium]